MPAIAPELLEILACPVCLGELRFTKEEVLFCVHCRHCFPVEDGIPQLSRDKALPLSVEGQVLSGSDVITFLVVSGPDEGASFHLEKNTCRALSRIVDPAVETQVFNADFTMAFEDQTRDVIRNYLQKTTGKKAPQRLSGDDLGFVRRLSDIILTDPLASRLHAMVFYNEGDIGVLDLVSRNGTFVNGKEVEASLVKAGDEIRIGNTVLKFSVKGNA